MNYDKRILPRFYYLFILTLSCTFLVDLQVNITQEFDERCNAISRETSKGESLLSSDSNFPDLSL